MALLLAGLLTVAATAGIDPDGEKPTDTPTAEVLAAAAEAKVEVVDLLGAMATTALPARQYLYAVGELQRPYEPPVSNRVQALADCIIFRESRGYARAVNPRSGASGLGQFLPSTWKTTPQGKAGLSVFDPVANRAAVLWMIQVGRTREFVTASGC